MNPIRRISGKRNHSFNDTDDDLSDPLDPSDLPPPELKKKTRGRGWWPGGDKLWGSGKGLEVRGDGDPIDVRMKRDVYSKIYSKHILLDLLIYMYIIYIYRDRDRYQDDGHITIYVSLSVRKNSELVKCHSS